MCTYRGIICYKSIQIVVESEREETHHLFVENIENIQVNQPFKSIHCLIA